MWRPVLAGKVQSYAEVRDEWTLDELLNCCELLDFFSDLEEAQLPAES